MDFGLHSNSLVFLLDDRAGFWFDTVGRIILDSGWICGETERLNEKVLENHRDGGEIAKIFAEKISLRLQANGTPTFAIVTDSEFGTDGAAGYCLLKAFSEHPTLGSRFRFGVVYSSRPLGETIEGRIERLEQRAAQLDGDAAILVEFFRTGELGAARQMAGMIERLCFFDLLRDVDVFQACLARASQIFRPVTTYGTPDKSFSGQCFCDPILEGIGATTTRPFSHSTLRWFDPHIFRSFSKYFDLNSEKCLLDRVESTLCPHWSLVSAGDNCNPATGEFGVGSLRLLWDAALSGLNEKILFSDYYPLLRASVAAPDDLDCIWEAYLYKFRQLADHSQPREAFTGLWKAAMDEVDAVRKAVRLARERGLS